MLETRVLGEQWVVALECVVPASPFPGTPILAKSVPLLKIHSKSPPFWVLSSTFSCQSRSTDGCGLVVISPEFSLSFAFTSDLPGPGLFDGLVSYYDISAIIHITNRDESRA
jgi:hypothetical protein